VTLVLCPSLAWAGGWYLLRTDVWKDSKPGSMWVADSKRPLKEWKNIGAFDSARECEEAKGKQFQNDMRIVNWQLAAGMKDAAEMNLTAASATMCVASDDPRLKD
jgi:hypothetical protein